MFPFKAVLLCAAALLEPVLLPQVIAASNAVVLQPVLNMYSGASEDLDVVSQSQYGANVEVLEESAGWTRIRTFDSYTGWVPAASLLKSERPYAREATAMEVASLFAHLYREPSVTKHRPVITVPFETRLETISAATTLNGERWTQVRLPGDGQGWVQTGDLRVPGVAITVDEMLVFSKRFLGLPYTWGGTTSFGYDCSGFTQMLQRQRGIPLPRDAGPQAAWEGLRAVERKDLEPGDLLFFAKTDKISHTGMYLGGGEFINATTHEKPMVRVDRLDSPHWVKSYVGARRPK